MEEEKGRSRGLGYKSSIQTAKQKVEGNAINTCQQWKIVAQWSLTPTAAKVRSTPELKQIAKSSLPATGLFFRNEFRET